MRRLMISLTLVGLLFPLADEVSAQNADSWKLHLRHRVETKPERGQFHTLVKTEDWKPSETAIVVCDMWDLHHCLNAVRREGEMAPRMNEVLHAARDAGATIIHAPSSCMDFYQDNPARKRAMSAPKAANLPEEIGKWCYQIPAEEAGQYPIDQTDGGEDDDPEEHAAWAKKLESMGRNPRAPWKRQIDVLDIDAERDFISDNGQEVWNILEHGNLKNVILVGVHTNMCVLGRPFGLRQMSRNGKNVVLMRDMTDTMYNPQKWPYVSHFSGTDLIVEHIEKFVCPTITSDQLIGGKEFRFEGDKRPHVAVVMAEDEYKTEETLPPFARHVLGKNFRVSLIFGSETDRNDIPGLDAVRDADVLLVSIRRRPLPKEQLDVFREFAAAGKPMLGIRTASHAFCLRNQSPPEGLADWPEFDAEVWGGSYSNHYGAGPKTAVSLADEATQSPILHGVDVRELIGNGSLYVVRPLSDSTKPLLLGTIPGKESEPIAWTNHRKHGGFSFYTSFGHKDDFKEPAFRRLLANAVHVAAGLEPPKDVPTPEQLVPPKLK